MKVVAVSCIHNDLESLINFSDKLENLKFDVIVCHGDFLDSPTKKFTSLELGKLIVAGLKAFGKPLLVVPGAWDKELISYFEKEKISIHGKGVVINNVGFYGFGGAKTPFNLPYEPSEKEIEIGLEKGYNEVKEAEIKIQVTHSPPANTKLDIISSGAHVGSEAVRKFIENKQPDAAVCSHIHESRGVDLIGKTKIINTGRFPEGHCGLITISEKNVNVELINLT
jgi:Icc-related predicted phosphoesterase